MCGIKNKLTTNCEALATTHPDSINTEFFAARLAAVNATPKLRWRIIHECDANTIEQRGQYYIVEDHEAETLTLYVLTNYIDPTELKNIKKLQSEAGVTGVHSPNIGIAEKLSEQLFAEYTIDGEAEETRYDCYLLISNSLIGKDLSGEPRFVAHSINAGNGQTMEFMVTAFLQRNPDMIGVFQQAVMNAILGGYENED